MILKDSGSLIDSKFEPGLPPEHKDSESLAGGVDGLGWELFDMFKWWQRGEHDLVKSHLLKVSNKLKGL
ncbi:MAG: hypothetical protein IPK04_20170 [Bdellovibrionales bacterium]|nr:hypothetical protein [Bdellovibrionales bacterium]